MARCETKILKLPNKGEFTLQASRYSRIEAASFQDGNIMIVVSENPRRTKIDREGIVLAVGERVPPDFYIEQVVFAPTGGLVRVIALEEVEDY